jgi:hypothetical protein
VARFNDFSRSFAASAHACAARSSSVTWSPSRRIPAMGASYRLRVDH